jgi:hypothetical protein
MARTGNVDNVANSVPWASSLFNKAANSVNQAALYGNTTPNAFVNGQTVGLFGIDSTEAGVSNGSIISINVTNQGSGYFTAPVITVPGGGAATASIAAGRVTSIAVSTPASGYTAPPAITIEPPAKTFNANADITVATDIISITSNVFQNGDRVTYQVSAGNTALLPLVNNDSYYVVGATGSGIQLAIAPNGAPVDFTAKGLTETGHTLVGQTAEAVSVVSGLKNKGVHSGWVIRKEGSGGRAGRVTFETLVAMGSLSGDGTDDTIAKDV